MVHARAPDDIDARAAAAGVVQATYVQTFVPPKTKAFIAFAGDRRIGRGEGASREEALAAALRDATGAP